MLRIGGGLALLVGMALCLLQQPASAGSCKGMVGPGQGPVCVSVACNSPCNCRWVFQGNPGGIQVVSCKCRCPLVTVGTLTVYYYSDDAECDMRWTASGPTDPPSTWTKLGCHGPCPAAAAPDCLEAPSGAECGCYP